METRSQPNPSGTDAAASLYTGEPGRAYHEGKRALVPEALPWVMELRRRKFQRYVRPSDTVFELGVGSGWNLGRLECARRMGCDAAVFLSPQLTTLGIEFVPDLRAVPGELADVVLAHHTLEHLLDPAEALRQLHRVLKPGGTLVLHVPWERERRYAQYREDEPNHHLYNWNAQNLGNLATVLGYRIASLTLRKYGYDRFAANLALRYRMGETGFRILQACLIALRPFREVELIARH